MATVIIKNYTFEDRFIEDLGISIDATNDITLSDIYDIVEISDSDDLKTYVTNEVLVVNNGYIDLDIEDGLKYINLETEYEDDETEDAISEDESEQPSFSDYEHSAKIDILYTVVDGSSDLTDFPFLIDITHNQLRNTDNGGYVTDTTNGFDITFTAEDCTSELDFEIESYDGSTGRIVAWVRIPTLYWDENTTIYIFYGNENIVSSQENVSGTFNNSFLMIHHMNDISGTITDSLGSHHSASETGMTYEQTGKIYKSIYFDESDDHYTITDFDYGDTFTISLWFKVTDNSGSTFQYFYSHNYGTNNCVFFYLGEDGVGAYADRTVSRIYDAGSTLEEMFTDLPGDINATDGEWHLLHVVRIRNSTSMLIIDGELQDSVSSANTDVDPTGAINIGRRDDGDANRYFGGNLEELRISNTNRTLEWCATEYNNQNSPGSYYNLTFYPELEANIICVSDSAGGLNVNVITPVAVPFNTDVLKNDTTFTHNTSTNNTRIYINSTGLYKINYTINWSIGTANDANIRTRIRKNGDTYIVPSTDYAYGINPDHQQGTNSSILYVSLTNGDYIEVMCDRAGDTPTTLTIAGASHLSMELI